MSYDISLVDPVSRKTLVLDELHQIKGGTYAVGGSDLAELNVTYNYSGAFKKALGLHGIRAIYGRTGAESIPVLKTAIQLLGDDADSDYWKPTEGNAKRVLFQLLAFAQLRPDGVWEGD